MDKEWFKDHGKLNEKEKKILYNELKNFDKYGEAIYQEKDLEKIAEKFEAITEFAESYLNENADSFDQVTINRNMKEIEKKVRKFKKEAKKVQKHQDRLTALYDDIGVKFNRYFEVGNKKEIQESNKPSTQTAESNLREIIRKEIVNLLKR